MKFIMLGPEHFGNISIGVVILDGIILVCSITLRNLGVIFDQDLSFELPFFTVVISQKSDIERRIILGGSFTRIQGQEG